MFRTSWQSRFNGAVALYGAACAICIAGSPAIAAEGVLLLQTGGVLRGEITQIGDRYLVRGEKSQMDVAASRVMLVCESMADAYDQQRRRMSPPTAETHLALAEWCLRYEMFDQTARELSDARQLDAQHPRLTLLERRLTVARAPRATSAVATDAAGASDKLIDELRSLNAMAAELPAGTVERFTRKVQPMLVNSCTTAGCHQPENDEHKFQLDRAVLHGLSNRRSTLQNLSATLALVNRDDPQASRLLAIPLEDHGDGKSPLLGSRQEEHLATLAEWIALATGKSLSLAEPAPIASASRTSDKVAKPASAGVMSTPAAQMLADQEEASLFEGMPPMQRGVERTSWQPKDEFDPEIFNRGVNAAAPNANGHERLSE